MDCKRLRYNIKFIERTIKNYYLLTISFERDLI